MDRILLRFPALYKIDFLSQKLRKADHNDFNHTKEYVQ